MPSELSFARVANAASDCGEVQQRLIKIVVHDYIVEALRVADIVAAPSEAIDSSANANVS